MESQVSVCPPPPLQKNKIKLGVPSSWGTWNLPTKFVGVWETDFEGESVCPVFSPQTRPAKLRLLANPWFKLGRLVLWGIFPRSTMTTKGVTVFLWWTLEVKIFQKSCGCVWKIPSHDMEIFPWISPWSWYRLVNFPKFPWKDKEIPVQGGHTQKIRQVIWS